jgi:hypothetical protein
MPFLAEKFKTYDQFASALLSDIYTAPKLQQSGQLAATTLASVLLRNDGLGRFAVEELPHRAQIAPIFGMVAIGDLLVCAQNSFAPEPETGRHDGGTGLVLRAAADGFAVVPPHEHGLCVFGDHKALVARAVGNDLELLFARNDGPLLALPVRARGVVEYADHRRAFEVHAGSGYLSQLPPLLGPGAVRVRWQLGRDAERVLELAPR